MKRTLPVIPLVLFIFLNACGSGMIINPDVEAAVVQTQTARAWTPTFTPMPNNYNESAIVYLLNSPLPEDGYLRRVEELETTMGAQYPVVDVTFPVENGVTLFRVAVHCQCAASVDCCNPERMFVEIIRKMEVYRDPILTYASYVPGPVRELQVYCMDHGEQLGIMTASWQDVRDFLNGQITGSQFGSRVRRK